MISMQEVASVKVMRESDAYTIKNSTPSKELMRRAGQAVFESVAWHGSTAIVCGGGNNAGDGYVLALYLKEAGFDVKLFLLEEKFSEDGRYYFEKCIEDKIEHACFKDDEFLNFDTIVDCIFGTGFHGEAEGKAKEVIEKINKSGKRVISVDINSGLNGDSGLGSTVVESDLTVSIGTYKSGHYLNMAKDVMKEKINCDIGIDIIGERYYHLDKEDFEGYIGKRKNYSHKGVYGYSAIIGGSAEYSGAVKLSNMSLAALRSGGGVNRLVVPEAIAQGVMPYLLESTLFKMPDTDGKMIYNAESLDEALSGLKSASVGMGWGKNSEYENILLHIMAKEGLNLVIDADGINTLARMGRDAPDNAKCRICLTPHLKEFERLSGLSREEIGKDPIRCAKGFAKAHNVILLLKGTATVITDGDNVFITDRGCPGMATAGSGDVLSGILAGLLGYLPFDVKTVALGAYIAGRAGEEAQKECGAVSMTASDTVRNIGKAIMEIS